ncbi:MAG: SsrA-binding protein [Verrucomicrobiales bacterium]|jgi:SsrA-binding protein
MASSKKKKKAVVDGDQITKNPKALRDFHILDKFEAGIMLRGTEVKSVRAGKINLRDAFCKVENGNVIMHGCDIQPYEHASHEQHMGKRPRRLLLNRKEITKLEVATDQQGLTIVALRCYWKKRMVKVEIATAKGKAQHDQRQDVKKRVELREAQREVSAFNKIRG